MTEYLTPFTRAVDLQTGTIPNSLRVQSRRLQDLKGLFADQAAESALMVTNPLLYEVYEGTDVPPVVGQLAYSTTVIYPGMVGDEYYMTKGHYHALGDRTEIYYGLLGEGYLLLQTPEGQISAQRMTPGTVAYIPPHWGHRTMNTGSTNFAFFSIYPADAGYDYKTIAENGFASIFVARNGKPELVPNPRYKPNKK
jgi:glucose-6-phosphate isomerase